MEFIMERDSIARAMLLLFLAIFISSSNTAVADTIILKNGMKIKVPRTWEENGMVYYEMFGSKFSYKKDEIERVEKDEPTTVHK
jgi:hypothetical protein